MESLSHNNLRMYNKIPVFIEEDHNDVVYHIHRAIASRHLPFHNIALVHFDSHPDLLLPRHLQADNVFDKEKLYREQSIENWILPMVYAGHVSDILWIKPPWCDQLPDTSRLQFAVGKLVTTGVIRTTLCAPYFLTEAIFAPETELSNVKYATLSVITLISQEELCQPNLSHCVCLGQCTPTHLPGTSFTSERFSHCTFHQQQQLVMDGNTSGDGKEDTLKLYETDEKGYFDLSRSRSVYGSAECTEVGSSVSHHAISAHQDVLDCFAEICSRPYILDIDLDLFSTTDPFRDEVCPEVASLLCQLFSYTLPADQSTECLVEFTERRQSQLDELHEAFFKLSDLPLSNILPSDFSRQGIFRKLVDHLVRMDGGQRSEELDGEMLYKAGCTFDCTPLPHHISSPSQICQLMDATKRVLLSLPAPTLISIARSSVDEYCPSDQVDDIQATLLSILRLLYTETDIHAFYSDKEVGNIP